MTDKNKCSVCTRCGKTDTPLYSLERGLYGFKDVCGECRDKLIKEYWTGRKKQ